MTDEYLNGAVSKEQIEQYTLGIIAEDAFESLPSNIQDLVYALDNMELNELTQDEIRQIRNELVDQLGTYETNRRQP